jgi:hypothetical protein
MDNPNIVNSRLFGRAKKRERERKEEREKEEEKKERF